jgi:hypothetical protein
MAHLLALALAVPAAAGPVIDGPAEVVFDWERDRCARWDIPDAPARAWRLPSGAVALLAGSEATRASRGPDLARIERDCAVLHAGAEDGDPAAFDDRSWIAAVHAVGSRVEGLAHVEYHGHLRPDRCLGDYAACWSNAIVALVSPDGGRTFERAEPALVAALPYRYNGEGGQRIGYFNPSNILRVDDHLHAFVFAERHGAQARGPCLLRRPVEGTARDWRAWDGTGFGVRFIDPYREAVEDPARHVCTPVAGLRSTVSSVVRDTRSGRYLAVTPAELREASDEPPRRGIWWSVSDDFVTWSAPQLLYEVPLLWRRDCSAPSAYAYPSLIDDDSPSAAFDTADERLWLYLVEMPLDARCQVGPRRNLVRLPVNWPDG